ncbi:MAG: Nif3-like dinuclear metal center hexameric protein [Ornithinimicrobium sp.]
MAALESLYPLDTAQSWDQVGLVVGEPERVVHAVVLAVDPTLSVIQEAADLGADLIISHHPLLLRGIHSAAADTSKGASLQGLILGDIALYCAHTNADVATNGVGHALASACGLLETDPLTISEGQELGRVGDLPESMTLREFAEHLGSALPLTASGMRVAGPPEATVQRVALLGGSGDHAFADVVASGADVYVTADLRHHPALEAREQAQVGSQTPYLVDAGHYASEALWLPLLQRALIRSLGDRGVTLRIDISTRCTDPWTFVVPTGSGHDSEHSKLRGEQ